MALSTWISTATNASLNMTPSTFSFKDALNPFGAERNGYYSTPFLFQDGCSQDDGSQNCTASCQDENKVFGSLDTLHNCMVYPTVADLFARNNLSDPNLPAHYNIEKARVNSTLYKNITTTIQTCVIDMCTATPGCSEYLDQSSKGRNMWNSPLNLTSTFYLYSDVGDTYGPEFPLCEYVPESFNPDIGGIGVYVSYWVQTGITLLSFALMVWWNWGVFYVCFGALLIPRGYSQAQKVAQRIRTQSRNKHLPSLTGALAEFQKAQCFFMLAINIAALVNRTKGGFQPNNLQQLYNTYILIKSISISGYLPVTFTLFTLHLVDVVSWYLLLLSAVTVFVSIATLFVLGKFNPSPDDLTYLSQQAQTGGPPSCGGKNLAVYCFDSFNEGGSTDPATGAYSMLAFCLVVLILLVAHQCHAFKDPMTGQIKPWLLQNLNAFSRKCISVLRGAHLRQVQMVLALIDIGLNGYAVSLDQSSNGEVFYSFRNFYDYDSESFHLTGPCGFSLFASCWTVSFALYLSLTSATGYTRRDRPMGRFFYPNLVLAVDCLSAVFWFASFISLAHFIDTAGRCGGLDVCGTITTSIIIAVFLCITFVVTTVLTARHMLHSRNDCSKKHTLEKQHWSSLPSWKQMSHRLPPWIKHPLIVDSFARLQQNTLPAIKVRVRRAYEDVRMHASTMDWSLTMTSATIFSLYLVFFGLYVHWFTIFIQDLKWFAYHGVDPTKWSFGQIVAISVWAEPLCEYCHLELRGMTRGFEHRLWGYKVVRIQQPDVERGFVSDSTCSVCPPSPKASHDGHEMGEFSKTGDVESTDEGRPARNDEHADRKKDEYGDFDNGDLATRPVLPSREGEDETDERESVGWWHIPETVILTSGSIAPF